MTIPSESLEGDRAFDEIDEDDLPQQDDDEIRLLRVKADQLEELTAEAEAAERRAAAAEQQLALVSSGVDFATPLGKLYLDALARSQHRNWTAEELRATAEYYGLPFKDRSEE